MWGVSFALSRGGAITSDLTFNCSSLSAGQVEHLILKVLLLTVAWHQSRGMAESSQDLIMTLFRQHWTFKSRKKEKKKQATFSCVPNGKDNQATIRFWCCLLDSSCFTFIHSIAQRLERVSDADSSSYRNFPGVSGLWLQSSLPTARFRHLQRE